MDIGTALRAIESKKSARGQAESGDVKTSAEELAALRAGRHERREARRNAREMRREARHGNNLYMQSNKPPKQQ